MLAHSLAAVSVNLQAAEGLLGDLPAGSPELAQAIECIGRAGTLTREGLAEARRAILALRETLTRLRWPISWRRWPRSTAPTGTRPCDFTRHRLAAAGRAPRPAWPRTGPRRRR